MDPALRAAAEAARGFMPPAEGLALYEAAASLAVEVDGPLLEVGSYCGKSAIYLGAAARERGRVLFSIDHHRGSEENQPGWEWHEPDLVDPVAGQIDTLPHFRRTVHDAGLEDIVIAVVGDSSTIAAVWATPLALVFIDGGHGRQPARLDYESWAGRVRPGGLLAVHDVFADPAEGGRAPYEEIYRPAVDSGGFEDIRRVGSLRVLLRLECAVDSARLRAQSTAHSPEGGRP
ncbi:MAG: class I SAM-dependent methyltransferase [Acidimicrobiales bacterium]